MVARIHHSELKPDQVDYARQLWESEIIPAMKRHKGFKNVYVLTHAKSRRVTTISIWESESAAADWANSQDFNTLSGKVKNTVSRIPPSEIFEVSISA